MRTTRFRPSFDRLSARITPSDGGLPMVPAYPLPPSDTSDDGGPDIPISYSDPGSYGNTGPNIPVSYTQ